MDPVAYSHFIAEKTEAKKKRLNELCKVTPDLIHKLDHILNSYTRACPCVLKYKCQFDGIIDHLKLNLSVKENVAHVFSFVHWIYKQALCK